MIYAKRVYGRSVEWKLDRYLNRYSWVVRKLVKFSTGRYIESVSILQGTAIVKKYVVWLLFALFCFTELFSYADITYLGLESSQGNDIIYSNNRKQIKGEVVERSPQLVIIKTYNVDSHVPKTKLYLNLCSVGILAAFAGIAFISIFLGYGNFCSFL